MYQFILLDSMLYNERYLKDYILHLHSLITKEEDIEEFMPKIINTQLSIENEIDIIRNGKYIIVKEMKNLLNI